MCIRDRGSNTCFIRTKWPPSVIIFVGSRFLALFSMYSISSFVMSFVSCTKRIRIGRQNLVEDGTGFFHTTFVSFVEEILTSYNGTNELWNMLASFSPLFRKLCLNCDCCDPSQPHFEISCKLWVSSGAKLLRTSSTYVDSLDPVWSKMSCKFTSAFVSVIIMDSSLG